MRLPVPTTIKIKSFAGGTITDTDAFSINAVYGKRVNGDIYAEQRPGVNIFEDASEVPITDARGRGIYWWEKLSTPARYFVNNDTVYKNSYSSPLGVTMSAGLERVEILEVGDYLVFIDYENNEGWTINSATSTTLVQITDLDFPPNQTPALTLCRGAVSLGGKLYVGTTDGDIYESDVENPTSWNPLSFRNAELRPDPLVYITEHHQHVVAFGTRSCEFFYQADNPTGSSLNPRLDIDYSVGAVNYATVWDVNDNLFFVGIGESGDVGVFVMENFGLRKLSDTDMDTFLTTAVNNDSVKLLGTGTASGGRIFYALTTYRDSNDATPVVSPTHGIVFSSDIQAFGFWDLGHTAIGGFPLIGWSRSNTTRLGEGILTNGDPINFIDDFNPQDTIDASSYVATGYVQPGYISETGQSGENYFFQLVLGEIDSGTRGRKFTGSLRAVADKTSASQLLVVRVADNGGDFSTGRTIDLSNPKNRLNRMGSFHTRNHAIWVFGDEQVRIEGIEYA